MADGALTLPSQLLLENYTEKRFWEEDPPHEILCQEIIISSWESH